MAIQHSDSVTDTATILTRLQESRREAAVAVAGGSGSAAIATMNFIVFVDDPAHREWVLERALVVVGKHPARLIVLDSTDALSGVDVSTVSQTRGDSIVINERVTIGVRPLDHGTIISLIAELSVPEIPLILWWSGRASVAEPHVLRARATGDDRARRFVGHGSRSGDDSRTRRVPYALRERALTRSRVHAARSMAGHDRTILRRSRSTRRSFFRSLESRSNRVPTRKPST